MLTNEKAAALFAYVTFAGLKFRVASFKVVHDSFKFQLVIRETVPQPFESAIRMVVLEKMVFQFLTANWRNSLLPI